MIASLLLSKHLVLSVLSKFSGMLYNSFNVYDKRSAWKRTSVSIARLRPS